MSNSSPAALYADNVLYLEELYQRYLQAPQSLPADWQQYFAALPLPPQTALKNPHTLLEAYRTLGHRLANTNPIPLGPAKMVPELSPAYHGLSSADVNEAELKQTYCGSLAAEFMHITDRVQREWIQQKLENARGQFAFSTAQKKRFLEKLTAAEGLERYLATQFVGQKRFSVEGADALIPMLDQLVEQAAEKSIQNIVLGMSHRGRLNVLVNILGKPARQLFDQFAGKHHRSGSGDVKYHDGFESDLELPSGKTIHLEMAFNPSHLEVVYPVVEGMAHARQQPLGETGAASVLPLVLHGEAAFAGQGVVMETLNLSQLPGYGTGGTLHIVINNQVGFTTDPIEARSTPYATDIGKMFEIPIFHVNGDDPEAAVTAIQWALDFRQIFHRDVIIELVCYRRLGHNESDEPMATQPLLYQKIKEHPTPRALYAQRLISQGQLTSEEEKALQDSYRQQLDQDIPLFQYAQTPSPTPAKATPVSTGVEKQSLVALAQKLTTLPEGFTCQPQVGKMMEDRQKMASGALPLDWGFAETLAYGALAEQSISVRLSGQDCQRGTFAHRHAVLHDVKTGAVYTPLSHLSPHQASVTLLNSILSEFGVMGFEYGYACVSPRTLTLWEAQFGDFANGAQVIIDQFLSAAEQKWEQYNGLTLLLPHGYEGQGPEHSSARLERYLQLCAEMNLIVCTPTTPAQIFHLLRRQAFQALQRPLVIMSPKSLLRHKLVVSNLEELAEGTEFQTVLPEIEALDPKQVKTVLFCAGKVYYDLLQKRREMGKTDLALIRLEQLYPFPSEAVKAILAAYPQAKSVIICQEEPQNQGIWSHVQLHLSPLLTTQSLTYAGRPARASTATGYANIHAEELKEFLNSAMGE